MKRQVIVSGKGTDKLLIGDSDMAFILSKGFAICSGCDKAIVTGGTYCARCNEELTALETQFNEDLERKPSDILYRAAIGIGAIVLMAASTWWGSR